MAFVNEYVSAEDKKEIDFSSISARPYGDPKITPVSPYIWTIDRERDVFLMWTWHGHEDAHKDNFFLYWWKGTPLGVRMDKTLIEPRTLLWRRFGLTCPAHLRAEYDEIVTVLKEALTVYGFDGDVGENVVSVEVQFDF